MIIGAAILSFAGEKINSAIYLIIPALFIMAILVLYSMEIKRIIWVHKNAKLADVKHGDGVSYDEERVQKCISEIIKALQNMAKNDVGAIVVLSTGNVTSQILDSGVSLDSNISSELIESVFFPKTPLHDGAMIINGTKIVAAGCFLPLSQNVDNIPKDLGTRHRAGIGVTETMDVISLIVSEETGIISIARAGKITRYADSEALKRVLANYYWQELESARK
jgi:diadenylate cyclase